MKTLSGLYAEVGKKQFVFMCLFPSFVLVAIPCWGAYLSLTGKYLDAFIMSLVLFSVMLYAGLKGDGDNMLHRLLKRMEAPLSKDVLTDVESGANILLFFSGSAVLITSLMFAFVDMLS